MKTLKLEFYFQARLERGLTQEELAEKVGTTKSYISKIENNIKEARLSTLHKIVEIGLGGHIELSINFNKISRLLRICTKEVQSAEPDLALLIFDCNRAP